MQKAQDKHDLLDDVENRKKLTFERNKINLSRFIKDQNQSYRKHLDEYLQKNKENEQQVGISVKKMKDFMSCIFGQNLFIKIFKNGRIYFQLENYQDEIKNVSIKYIQQVKQMAEYSLQNEKMLINEDQILDFLTFWLKNTQNNQNLFIIYARTQPTMSQLEKQYKDSFLVTQTKQTIKLEKQMNSKDEQATSENEFVKDLIKVLPVNQHQNPIKPISEVQSSSKSILNRYRLHQNLQTNTKQDQRSFSKLLTKEQRLQKIIPQLFTFACKNRARTLKNTTFDQIQDESKFMNLEKFINFCNHLDINHLIQRQTLIEQFKLHAINRLTLNVQKFAMLLKNLVSQNQQVINKLLSKQKLHFLKRKNHIKHINLINLNSLSKYNYQLRPINGKAVESIEQELKQKKQIRQTIRKQKNDILLKKKQGYMSKQRHTVLQKSINISKPSISESKISFLHPNQNTKKQSRDDKRLYSEIFNPESLISNVGEDKLWQEYEAKNWKTDNHRNEFVTSFVQRDQSPNKSILESALSKRIERGNKVLKKIVSSSIKYYQ